MTRRRRWSEFSPRTKVAIVAAGIVETTLTAIALRDLARRPAAGVRGPKALWFLGVFVQPVGPPLYLVVGRKR